MDAADNHAQLACYHEIERFMWNDVTGSSRNAFLNALYAAMPQYRWVQNVLYFISSQRWNTNINFTPEQIAVYRAVHAKSSPDKRIYVAIIIFARNLIRHGYDCSVDIVNPVRRWYIHSTTF